MATISWILVGLVAGYIARRISPRQAKGGFLFTLVIGWAGALLGGFLATVLGFGGLSGFDIRSLVTATLGAIVLLLLSEIRYRSK